MNHDAGVKAGHHPPHHHAQPSLRHHPPLIHPRRRRRLGFIAGCVAPALVLCVFMIGSLKMMQNWQRLTPELEPLEQALIAHSVTPFRVLPPGSEVNRGIESAEIFIAARFGNFIRDPKAWNSRIALNGILPKTRAEAERFVAKSSVGVSCSSQCLTRRATSIFRRMRKA